MSVLNAESRHEIIEVPLFGSRFAVCRGTEKQNRKFLKAELGYKTDEPLLPSSSVARLMTLHALKTDIPIWVLLYPKRVHLSVVIHELYHLVKAVVQFHGVEDEETEAYLLEWFTETLTGN